MKLPKDIKAQFVAWGSQGGKIGGKIGGAVTASRMTPEQKLARSRNATAALQRKASERRAAKENAKISE